MSGAIGNDISAEHIAICGEDREVLLRVPFSEAYEVKPGTSEVDAKGEGIDTPT